MSSIRALTKTPIDRDLFLTQAVWDGDIQLLSRFIDFLDSKHPEGWSWSQYYPDGVGRILSLAAACNLKSLQYLVKRYPLWPGSSEDAAPQSVLDHGFYSLGNVRYAAAFADLKNGELVMSALVGGRYDCASFLLRQYRPPLFKGGFLLRGNLVCYASAPILQFLLDHGACLGVDPLHHVASLAGLPDVLVFDAIVQRGFGVDSPRHAFEDSPVGEVLTPLHAACDSLQPANVEALLRLGANSNGISQSTWIRKVPLMTEFQYYSPHPILALLFSSQWDIMARDDYHPIAQRFLKCFQSLLRYGARTVIQLDNGSTLEILVHRIWRILYQSFDQNQGVQSLFFFLENLSLPPSDEVCLMVSAVDPTREGRDDGQESLLLIQLFRDYQEKYGDLPGPAQLRGSDLLFLPDRLELNQTNVKIPCTFESDDIRVQRRRKRSPKASLSSVAQGTNTPIATGAGQQFDCGFVGNNELNYARNTALNFGIDTLPSSFSDSTIISNQPLPDGVIVTTTQSPMPTSSLLSYPNFEFELSPEGTSFLDSIFLQGHGVIEPTTNWDSIPTQALQLTNEPQNDLAVTESPYGFLDIEPGTLDTAIDSYFTFASVALPVLSKEGFMTDYKSHLSSPALVYAVACRGCPFIQTTEKWMIQQRLASRFRETFLQAQSTVTGQNVVRLDDLEALALMVDFEYESSECFSSPLQSQLQNLLLTHDSLVVMTLQYRIETRILAAGMYATLSEATQRQTLLFWYVYGWDAFFSLDRRAASRIRDDDIDLSTQSHEYESQGYFDAILSLAGIARKMARTLCGPVARRKGARCQDIENLYKQLEEWHTDICPSALQIQPPSRAGSQREGTSSLEACVSQYGIEERGSLMGQIIDMRVKYETLQAAYKIVEVAQWIEKLTVSQPTSTSVITHVMTDLAPGVIRNICAGASNWLSGRAKEIFHPPSHGILNFATGRPDYVFGGGNTAGLSREQARSWMESLSTLRNIAATATSHRDTEQLVKRLDQQIGSLKELFSRHEGHSDFGDFGANTSSISITLVSTKDDEDMPFFDFHYSSPFLNHSTGGTDHVTKNSIYRIGSISKLFTAYTLLVGYGWESWDRPVTRYVPELRAAALSNTRQPIEDAYWDEITIGDLASQLSGIGRDYANGDLASQNFPWMEAGLPELSNNDVPHCGGNSSLPPCNRREYFKAMLQRHPVFAPHTTPVYSNIGFRMLGYVLEAMGGTSYAALLQSKVLRPLGLTDTSGTLPPNRGSWVIPSGNETGFHYNYGEDTPTAGIYSSSDNLARLGRSILLNKQLSDLDTRKWMKPTSHTSSLFASVGGPWEIWRTKSQITSGRVVDLYTKSGSVGQYTSQLILLPDYGVSLSILVAGSSSGSVITISTEMVLQSLIPVLENVTISEACDKICGTYESSRPNTNSSITVAADASGLYLDRWVNQGVDIKAVAEAYAIGTGSPSVRAVRIQATNLQDLGDIEQGGRQVAYRISFDTSSEGTPGPPRILDPNAHQWSSTDSPLYGGIGVDDFVVHFDTNGTAVMIEPRVVRDILQRSQ
ncbi:hypothetical protein O1611_g4147 [Lasiodiplodia mahajangana]|uniref:Uncharacterized protein n=1 Tax=Lasiodiplodia mahajangana TaxID=1108764 RepID=A0ACC2JPQ5_9PEZI|nr:hypothetical protein O1611_g4147 [Lasiodiplodia mahajangana]